MELSILITYFPNRFEQLKRGLNSILLQSFNPANVELLFFNDGGDKKALSLLATYCHKISIRHFEIRRSLKNVNHSSTRRNYLIRQAIGKYLLFTEPEMVHVSCSITQTLKAFKKYGENIWYCGQVFATNEVVNPKGEVRIFDKQPINISSDTLGLKPSTTRLLNLNFFKKNTLFRKVNYEIQKQFSFWCTAIAKKNLVKVKGLKENLQKWGSEEIDLYNRLERVGVRRIFDPNFVTYHLPHPVKLLPEEKFIWGMYNNNLPFSNDHTWGLLKGEQVIETRL